MAKTLSSKQWAHYVRAAKEAIYASIFQAYKKPSADKIRTWRELTRNTNFSCIVSKNTFNYTLFRRVHDATGTTYIVDTRDNRYSISRLDLLEVLKKEGEKELMLYIIDVERICYPMDLMFD